MKKWFILISVLLLFTQCGLKNDWIINNNRVGNIMIGKYSGNIFKKLSEYRIEHVNVYSNSSASVKYYNVYEGKTLILSLYFHLEKLEGIQVHSNKFFTMKGGKIGNTCQEVIHKGHRVWAIRETQLSLMSQTEMNGVFFYFDMLKTRNNQIGANARLKYITIGTTFDIFELLRNKQLESKK